MPLLMVHRAILCTLMRFRYQSFAVQTRWNNVFTGRLDEEKRKESSKIPEARHHTFWSKDTTPEKSWNEIALKDDLGDTPCDGNEDCFPPMTPEALDSRTKIFVTAEKVASYSTPHLNLHSLFNGQVAIVMQLLRKLIGTDHPLVETIKSRLVYNGKHNVETRGLIVLLVAKAASPLLKDFEIDDRDLECQRSLADIIEMIHIAYLIHKGILNASPLLFPDADVLQNVQFGNKIAVLCGDYLLANASKGLAGFRNAKVVDLIATAIGHFVEAEFIGKQDRQGLSLLHSALTIDDWNKKNTAAVGSLLANGCQAALELNVHDCFIKEQAFTFGKHVALAWQAQADLQPFTDHKSFPVGNSFDLMSAPIIFHLQEDKSIASYVEQFKGNLSGLDYKTIHDKVIEGQQGIEQTRELCKQHVLSALVALDHFPSSDAKACLQNILQTI